MEHFGFATQFLHLLEFLSRNKKRKVIYFINLHTLFCSLTSLRNREYQELQDYFIFTYPNPMHGQHVGTVRVTDSIYSPLSPCTFFYHTPQHNTSVQLLDHHHHHHHHHHQFPIFIYSFFQQKKKKKYDNCYLRRYHLGHSFASSWCFPQVWLRGTYFIHFLYFISFHFFFPFLIHFSCG